MTDLPSSKRYSSEPFPPYRHVPGVTAHPRTNREGHSYGKPEPTEVALSPEDWKECDGYLYAIDLFNFAYWWECHELLEALWHGAGGKGASEQAQFLQGIIQIAVSLLRRSMDQEDSAKKVAQKGLDRLEQVNGPIYMGVNVEEFKKDVREFFDGKKSTSVLISLVF